LAREAAKEAGLGPTCNNPFRSLIVRAVEVLYACDEALRIIDAYQERDEPHLEITPRAGVGYACTEAPRGMLYHRYRLDAEGTILDAKIVPPTSQNQPSIEDDLKAFAGFGGGGTV
jgi:coenzyme F420-reducing hydrogenase alpha subunit